MKFFNYFLYLILYACLGAAGFFLFKMYVSNNSVESQKSDIKMMPISEQWELVNVSDGDTIRASKNGVVERFRLCGIDAPEKSQPLGEDSKNYLLSLVSPKNKISISISDTDRYGRKIAEIFVIDGNNEKFLNEELIKAGLAYHYAQYSGNCPNKISLENAEAIAKSQGIGVWRRRYSQWNGNHVPPWEYRKANRN
jgi:micrococcal nuclease